jgi:cytoskeletal protein CcmA (bactofilin family)
VKSKVDKSHYIAATLKRANFVHAGDIIINGDVRVPGTLLVCGDLQIAGNLTVGNLICIGNICVARDIHFEEIILRGTLTCEQNVKGFKLRAVTSAEEVAPWFHGARREKMLADAQAYIAENGVDDDTLAHSDTIDVKGCVDIDEVYAKGNVVVGGDCEFAESDLYGQLSVGGDVSGYDIYCSQHVYVQGNLHVLGDLNGYWIHTVGYCSAQFIEAVEDLYVGGAIVAETDIVAGGHIRTLNRIQARGAVRAGQSIQAAASIFAPKGVQCGERYSIFAGLQVPEQHLEQHGFVAARVVPTNLKHGMHVKGKRFRELTEGQRRCWPGEDSSDELN